MDKITVAVPCYNEEECIPLFFEKVEKVVAEIPEILFEYIFVNDGSKDKTAEILRELSQGYEHVHYISFSRNFGKEAAMYAGMKEAKGDYVVIMDADLQDPPELLPQMYEAIKKEGFDCQILCDDFGLAMCATNPQKKEEAISAIYKYFL